MIQIISFKLQRIQSREKNSHGNLPNILVNRKPSERGKERQKGRNLYSKLEMIFKTFFFILFKNGLRKVLEMECMSKRKGRKSLEGRVKINSGL